MTDADRPGLSLLPDEMLRFVVESSHNVVHAPRLGQLLSHGRAPIHTPHYVAATSRGVVPHLAQDVFQQHTPISAVYMGLEDFIEKSCQNAPILKTPVTHGESTLRKFTALPSQCLSILGPRRIPRVPTAAQNTDSSIAICTSVGFRTLELSDYVTATTTLRPDISLVLPDVPAAEKMSKRRIEKAADRTQSWLRYTLSQDDTPASPIFASIPPLEAEQQQLYLSSLSTEYLESLTGVCMYDPATALILPPQLSHLPLLCISDPPNPHALLHAISLGVDLITAPFVTAASEQGIALTFTFPPPSTSPMKRTPPSQHAKHPLGIDLYSSTHATSLGSLAATPEPGITNATSDSTATATDPKPPCQCQCQCYTCTRHHRAYIHHLLSAREMLAWTLLQIHNFHVLSLFFSAVRHSIRNGTFDADRQAFHDYYSEGGFGVIVEHETDTDTASASASAKEAADINNANAAVQIDDGVAVVGGGINNPRKKDPKERGPRLRGYQMKSSGRGADKPREKIWGRFDAKDGARASSARRSETPAELATGVENNQAGQVRVAEDSTGASRDLELTASDFESLGLAEKEEDAKDSDT